MVPSAKNSMPIAALAEPSDSEVWIVEDDPGCRFIYEEILQHRYRYRIFPSLNKFKSAFYDENIHNPALVIADLRLPDGSFVSLYQEIPVDLRVQQAIMVVSICDDLDVMRHCLSEGVRDYLTKPFNRSELLVKIERSLHRSRRRSMDHVKVDLLRQTVSDRDENSSKLTARELEIFNFLYTAKEHRATRQEIVEKVWGKAQGVGPKTLDVHIFNLRKKLKILGLELLFTPPQSYHLRHLEKTPSD